MDRVESYFQKHQFLVHTIGGLLATAVILTSFVYTNFQTKAEAKAQIDAAIDAAKELNESEMKGLKTYIKLRFDLLDVKIDHNHSNHRGE